MQVGWQLQGTDQEYRDYVCYLLDIGGYGGRVMLTINTAERSASLCIVLDNEDGEQFGEIVKDGVSLEWALAIARAIDGFTLPET